MPDIKQVLRDLADAYEREEEGENTKKLAEEIADLKAKVEATPKVEVQDALEEISDEEYDLIRQHRAAASGPPPPKAKEEPKVPPVAKRTRPGRKSGAAYEWYVDDDGKVVKTDIAHIYNGPDEESEVELPAEEEAVA